MKRTTKKQRLITYLSLIPLILLITSTKSDYSPCIYNKPHITLGSLFSNYTLRNITSEIPANETLFTISLTTAGDCSKSPPVLQIMTKTSTTLQNPNKTSNYVLKWSDPDVNYNRTAHFFYIQLSMFTSIDLAANALTWNIIQADTKLFFDIPFPQRAVKVIDSVFTNGSLYRSNRTRIAVVANLDISAQSQKTIQSLIEYVDQSEFDIYLHNGNFACDIFDSDGQVGDSFFNQLFPITSRVPFMITGGPDDYLDSGAILDYRFQMPGTNISTIRRNAWYSATYNNVHIIVMNFDNFFNYFPQNADAAFTWLKRDLEAIANYSEKAKARNMDIKWKLFFSSRPFYCKADQTHGDCGRNFMTFRRFEALLLKHKVRMIVSGHLFAYTRSYPTRNWISSSLSKNTSSPVFIVNGLGGNRRWDPSSHNESDYLANFVDKVRKNKFILRRVESHYGRISLSLNFLSFFSPPFLFCLFKFF